MTASLTREGGPKGGWGLVDAAQGRGECLIAWLRPDT